MDKLVALVVAKKKLDSKVWPKGSVSVLVKLSVVHDCFVDGNLHVLLFKEKVSILWYCMFWHLCLDLINLNDIQDLVKDGFLEPLFFLYSQSMNSF